MKKQSRVVRAALDQALVFLAKHGRNDSVLRIRRQLGAREPRVKRKRTAKERPGVAR